MISQILEEASVENHKRQLDRPETAVKQANDGKLKSQVKGNFHFEECNSVLPLAMDTASHIVQNRRHVDVDDSLDNQQNEGEDVPKVVPEKLFEPDESNP